MLSESLRVPYRANDAVGTILVGSVLTLLSGLFVLSWAATLVYAPPLGAAFTVVVMLPSLLIRGYLLSVVEAGIDDEKAAPSFVQWGSLVRAGSKSTLVSVVYLFPGAILCGLFVGGVAVTVISPPGFGQLLEGLTGVVVLVAGLGVLGYGLVYVYIRPAARAVFAATGSVRTTVGFRRVLRLASTSQYLSGWLIAMGLVVVGPTLATPLLVVAGVVGVFSPVLAVVFILATILLTIGLLFVSRVWAAWVTGRGAAGGVVELYSVTMTDDDETAVVVATEISPGVDRSHSEAPPTVQTGRTVDTTQSESRLTQPDAPNTTTESTESNGPKPATEALGHDLDTATESADRAPTTETTEMTNHELDDDTTESVDEDQSEADDARNEVDDSEFVWGLDNKD